MDLKLSLFSCRTYEDDVARYGDLRLKTNDIAIEYIAEKTEYEDDIYTVISTKELIPPHIVTDGNRSNKFTIKAGLVLYHGTVHAKTVNFKYPNRGSFFATTPAHSLSLIGMEKRKDVLEGIGYFTEDELLTTNQSYEKKMQARCPRPPLYDATEEQEEEYELCQERVFAERTPGMARLLTYVLKKDITVRDASGDTLSLDKCLALDCDGVMAGYNRNSHHEDLKDIMGNLNELRLCGDDIENYLELVDERIIDSDELKHPFFTDFNNHYNDLTFNHTIKDTMVCNQPFPWVMISNVDSVMHLYYTLMYKKHTIDLVTLTMMFLKDSDIYYHAPSNTLVVFNRNKIKVWSDNLNLKYAWDIIKTLLSFYTLLSEGIIVRRMKFKLVESVKITLYDNLISKLQSAGYPIDQFL